MSELTINDGLDAMEVASYLRRHPEFLNEFPDLALALVLPREQGSAASLASYQLDVLRDKNRELVRRRRARHQRVIDLLRGFCLELPA